ncbi:MAG: HD domain-containing protein [Lachnospiraceae bacterium]|nr:HD domain-containing protein [Lachnospiraceae bacterium]
MKREVKLHGYVFFITLLAIIIAFAIVVYQTGDFNSRKNTSEVGNGSGNRDDVKVTSECRGGNSGKWTKNISIDIPGDKNGQLTGEIYDITINNDSSYAVHPWTLRIDIGSDCYINSAWCGSVEIHQHVVGMDKTQMLDLRTVKPEEISLDYFQDDSDLLIPLKKGDYIIYYPSESVEEDYIETKSKNKTTTVIIGLILYYNADEVKAETNLDNMLITYNYKADILSLPQFNIAVAAFIVWIIALLIVVVSDFKTSEFRKKELHNRQTIRELLFSMADAVDGYSGCPGHSIRVANITYEIARKMGYGEDECRDYYYAALLHDIGKMQVPEFILLKNGHLSEDEEEVIKKHTRWGSEKIKRVTTINNLDAAILSHHENYDGTGYPFGVMGDEIPMVARIIAVANACEKLSASRTFRAGLPIETILSEIYEGRGTLYDPDVVDAMARILENADEDTDFLEERNV